MVQQQKYAMQVQQAYYQQQVAIAQQKAKEKQAKEARRVANIQPRRAQDKARQGSRSDFVASKK